eukprot:2785586-Pyramimonas_sp.AAC.1
MERGKYYIGGKIHGASCPPTEDSGPLLSQTQQISQSRSIHYINILKNSFMILLHFTGPPVPITARMLSTPQIADSYNIYHI